MVKRSKKEIKELVAACAAAIQQGPQTRGPEPVEQVTMAEARRRAKLLVSHCLKSPVVTS